MIREQAALTHDIERIFRSKQLFKTTKARVFGKLRQIGTSREFGKIRRRKHTNQKSRKLKEKQEYQGDLGKMKRKNAPKKKKKLKENPEIQKPTKKGGLRKSPKTNEKFDPRKFRSSARRRRRRLRTAGIGFIGRCALKILGPFGVSYIPPAESASAEVMDPPPGSSSGVPPPGSSNPFTTRF